MSLLKHEFKALGKHKLWNVPVKSYFIHSELFHTCLPFETDSYSAKGLLQAILVNQFIEFYRLPTIVC